MLNFARHLRGSSLNCMVAANGEWGRTILNAQLTLVEVKNEVVLRSSIDVFEAAMNGLNQEPGRLV